MIIQLLVLTIGFVLLLWAADRLVIGASGLAYHYNVPPLIIGLTLVAFSTSAPEIMVAISASINGMTDMAVGNAIGSNIANIGLVLGLTGLLRPVRIQSTLVRREYPILFIIMLFTYTLIIDGYLGAIDGALLVLLNIAVVFYLIYSSRKETYEHTLTTEFQKRKVQTKPLWFYSLMLIAGIIFLPIGSHFVVQSSARIAQLLEINELVIGLTVIAIGTSLPELVTSLVAAIKGADDIAIGNILGSNMFNLMAVMAFPGIIHPAPLNHHILWRDVPIMFIITLLLLWMNLTQKQKITRWQGGLLVVIYICYIIGLILDATA